jgi:16S rRNA (guanine527-N7)-methyltransferase
MERLEQLASLVVEENSRQNLIAKSSESSIWVRHLADSAQLLAHVPRETSPWLDLGTGAGFPGIVIAALRPNAQCVLIESRKKRVEWLERAAAALRLTNCRVVGKRLEHVESFEAAVISARAFAPLPKLIELSARFSTRSTLWLLPKGRSAVQELSSLSERTGAMFHVEQSVTDGEAGIVMGTGRPDVS